VPRPADVTLLSRSGRPARDAAGLRGRQRQGERVPVPARRDRGCGERTPLALEQAPTIGFGRYIISATTPFTRADLQELRTDAPAVVRRLVPGYEEVYQRRGWSMFPGIDRVYVNDRARSELGWEPRYDFARVIDLLHSGQDPRSDLARTVGSKGYHTKVFADGPYPLN
jgi:UDP-glucose 4-epimerase